MPGIVAVWRRPKNDKVDNYTYGQICPKCLDICLQVWSEESVHISSKYLMYIIVIITISFLFLSGTTALIGRWFPHNCFPDITVANIANSWFPDFWHLVILQLSLHFPPTLWFLFPLQFHSRPFLDCPSPSGVDFSY